MNEFLLKVEKIFKEKFKQEPHLYYSPGRINFIGEHIDYNDGFVMPAAIDKGIYFAIALNNSEHINCYSIDFDESISLPLSDVKKMDSWKNYVLGVVNEFQKMKLLVKGFDCVFGGDIPIGGGMSSSAALEGGISFGLNELCNFGKNRKELALLGQRAEHDFPGVMCGIMDQYANMMGKKNTVILLDCMNVTHEYVPFDIPEYEIILINTKVHHSLAASEYNQRRKECEKGLEILQRESDIQSFRDVKSADELFGFEEIMGNKVYMRCLYVVEEIERTKKAAKFLKENDIIGFGKLMFQTHEGLKNLYEVSCKELDFLVDVATENKEVVGARLMGGGFGGSTINIIRKQGASSFLSKILPAYKKQFNIDAEIYDVKIVNGTGEITKEIKNK
ncbi:MAG: galactokinase [Bacteroidota bacterium]|nr:galactokinase [Bacteroidota bacterium]